MEVQKIQIKGIVIYTLLLSVLNEVTHNDLREDHACL